MEKKGEGGRGLDRGEEERQGKRKKGHIEIAVGVQVTRLTDQHTYMSVSTGEGKSFIDITYEYMI